MQTVEIQRERWSTTLGEFSALHEGWLVSVDVLAAGIGAQPEVRDFPLVGVVAEPGAGGGVITISASKPEVGQITHTIHAPSKVWIERTNDGADAAMQIESADGTRTILRLRTAASPDTVDLR